MKKLKNWTCGKCENMKIWKSKQQIFWKIRKHEHLKNDNLENKIQKTENMEI
jgi:hypothetical protein